MDGALLGYWAFRARQAVAVPIRREILMRWIAGIVVLATAAWLIAADDAAPTLPEDNPLLRRLFDDDQADRKTGSIDAETVKRDSQRRKDVLTELRSGRIRTASDYYHAGFVFQHGESADEISLAFSLAWTSAQMESPIRKRALWLSAAAWDRLLMRLKKPQWYGTQYVADDADAEFRLYDIDEEAVTDEERIRLNVPVLSEAKKQVERFNRRPEKKADE